MVADSLFELFSGLAPPAGDGESTFSTARIKGYPSHRLGKTAAGEPALLVAVAAKAAASPAPPVRLTHLTIQHETRCRIESRRGAAEETFSVVRLRGADPLLVEYFLTTLPAFITAIGVRPTRTEINTALASLVELFRALADAPATTVQGLWAELFLISQASEPLIVAKAWHAVPEERYDFCLGAQRVEVKSASGRRRQHHFSLEQLRPAAGACVLVASVLMERAAGGTALGTLLGEVRKLMAAAPDTAIALEKNVARLLGRDWEFALKESFDAELAASTLQFYPSRLVPCIPTPLPDGISGVHFVADLTHAKPLKLGELRKAGGLTAACTPR